MTVRDVTWVEDDANARLRSLRFARRVPLRVESTAAIANAMAQRVSQLLAAPVRADLFPPVMLEAGAWESLCKDAFVYEIRGERTDAALLCTKVAARRITERAFGEEFLDDHRSALELSVLDRFVTELAGGLEEICAAPRVVCARADSPQRRGVYCELRIREPLAASVGIATNEPPATIGPCVSARALDECPIECSVRLGVGAVDIFTIAALAVGDVLRLKAKVGESATLNLGANVIAAGEGGVLGDRSAFRVHQICSQ